MPAVARVDVEYHDARNGTGRNPNVGGGPFSPPPPNRCLVASCVLHALLGAWMFADAPASMFTTRAARSVRRVKWQHGPASLSVIQSGLKKRITIRGVAHWFACAAFL